MKSVPFWLLLAGLASCAGAAAQPSDTGSGQPFRKWDAGGSFAIRFGSTGDGVVPAGGWSVEAGRYWTAHVTTSLGVATAGDPFLKQSESSSQTYSYSEAIPRPAAVSSAISYQFYENVFAYPYVTAVCGWDGSQRPAGRMPPRHRVGSSRPKR